MSVPLDRLYNHLDGLCNHDIVIYRFSPHGSKKLADLDELSHYKWQEIISKPGAIFHDQEPLVFNQYLDNDILNHFLTIDASLQGSPDNLKRITSLISEQNIRAITSNRIGVYDQALLIHSEKNSHDLVQYEQAGFVGVYWWAHAAIAIDWYRYANHDPILKVNFDNIKWDFLLYNRAWSGTREYRLKLAEHIVNAQLVDNCLMKFSPVCDGKHYTEFCASNPKFKIEKYNLENYFDLNNTDSSASADYDNNDYKEIGIEIVLETLFDDSRLHLTEKALRPIACGRPFILAGTAGSLAYLRSYGFQTFDGLIDESYDTITDNSQRLQYIVKEMKRISSLPADQKHMLWKQLYEIADYNMKLFFDNQWQETIFKEFTTNMQAAMHIVNQSKTGYYWNQFRNYWNSRQSEWSRDADPRLLQSIQHQDEIDQLLKKP
jgi:hypothetical protein